MPHPAADSRPPGSDESEADAGSPPQALARGANAFARALVRRPVTVLMLFLTLLGTGVISYLRIPLTLLPRGLSSSSLSVSLPWPGAGPSEVADQLARPVEEALRTIPGIRSVVSYSSENGANVQVEFGSSVDMDLAYGEVRDRLERTRPRLPPEMDRYRIRRWNSNTDMPVLWAGVQFDEDDDTAFERIEKLIVPRIEGVEGVARAGTWGLVDEAVRIFVDVEKVGGYGIDLGQVIARLRADNFELPAGRIDDGGRRFNLRVDARLRSEQELRDWPLGNGMVLGDIAEIVRGRAWRDSVWRVKGRPAVGLEVSRESDQNTIEVCRRVEELLEQLETDPRLAGLDIEIFWSQKDTILRSVNGLQASALWGGLFAILVLFVFLRDVRLTLVASLAIPASLLAALAAVYFGGQTLNMLSLTGFTLAIGMLVDNAVVVVENIARKRSLGSGRRAACAAGAGEVGLAVLAATTTSIVVFLPLVFMDGDRNMRIMTREIGLPISWSLFASLVVALVFIPAFTARLMSRRGEADEERLAPEAALAEHGRVAAPSEGRLSGLYSRLLQRALRRRFVTVLLLLGLLGLSSVAGSNLRASLGGGGGDDSLSIQVEVPPNCTLADVNSIFRRLESWAEELAPDLGLEHWSARFDRRGGRLSVWPHENASREERDALEPALRERLPELPGCKLTLGRDRSGGSARETRVNLVGPDFGVLAQLAEDLKVRLAALRTEQDGRAVPLLDNVRTDIERGRDEIHVAVDRNRASELGVSPEAVRGVVAWGLSGQRLPDLVSDDRETRVQIEYGRSDEESLLFLRNLAMPRNTGGQVPLATLADIGFGRTPGTLVRRNGEVSTGVGAQHAVDDLYLVSAAVDAVLADFPFPEGYGWRAEGGRQDFEEDMSELFSTLLLSVVLVYLVMAILLESMVLPLSILLSIPLAGMGVNLTLWATGTPKEPMVYVGLILLAGIVVNNAIVLLDRVQRLREAGHARHDALLTGAGQRLRPILMTALTTIFGLLPMAAPSWFPGEGSSGYESMAVTVAGGLAFSTLLTLFVVPVFYTFFDDLRGIFARLWPWRSATPGTTNAGGDSSAGPARVQSAAP